MTFIGSFGSFGSFAACSSKGTGVPQPFDSCKPNVSWTHMVMQNSNALHITLMNQVLPPLNKWATSLNDLTSVKYAYISDIQLESQVQTNAKWTQQGIGCKVLQFPPNNLSSFRGKVQQHLQQCQSLSIHLVSMFKIVQILWTNSKTNVSTNSKTNPFCSTCVLHLRIEEVTPSQHVALSKTKVWNILKLWCGTHLGLRTS